jgi:hypothetical protein
VELWMYKMQNGPTGSSVQSLKKTNLFRRSPPITGAGSPNCKANAMLALMLWEKNIK